MTHINFEKKKICICLCAAIFMLVGMILHICGTNFVDRRPSSERESVSLSGQELLAQKIIGNDYYIEKIKFYVTQYKIDENDTFNVYLMLGGYDLSNDMILDHVEVSADTIIKNSILEIKFKKTKLMHNRDYYVVLNYNGEEKKYDNEIYLSSNTEHYGLYGNNLPQKISLAYDIEYFSYYNKLLLIWNLIFIFVNISVTICLIRKINFQGSIGLVCIGTMLLLYIFAVFGILKWSYPFILLVSLVSFINLIKQVLTLPDERLKDIAKQNIIPGILSWAVMLGIYLLIDANQMIHMADDWTQWARAPKDMYLWDSLPLHSKSTAIALNYPPAYSLFQYLFFQMFGKSSDGVLYFALHFLETSFLLSCLDIKFRNTKKLSLSITFMFLCIGLPNLIFNAYTLDSIYADVLVGCLLGYVLIRLQKYFEDNSFKHLSILLISMAVLVLVKDNGLIFLLALFLGQITLTIYHMLRKNNQYSNMKLIAGMLFSIVIAQISWQLCLNVWSDKYELGSRLKATNVTERAHLSPEGIINYLKGNGKSYQYDLIPAHIMKLLFNNDFSNGILGISIVGAVIIICIVFYVIYSFKNKRDKLYLMWIGLIGSTCIFTVGAFHLLYTFTFNQKEALRFASESRYIGSLILGILMLTVYHIYNVINEANEDVGRKINIGICISIFILTNYFSGFRQSVISEYATWTPNIKEQYGPWKNRTDLVREIMKEDERLFVFMPESGGTYAVLFGCYLSPIKVENKKAKSSEEWKQLLLTYDYFCTSKCDEQFYEVFGEFVNTTEESDTVVLYRINTDSDKLLEKMCSLE